jgi:hypothetical protein
MYQMSYDRYICLLKELQTKPLSISIDRKGVNLVVLHFLNIRRAKFALPYSIKILVFSISLLIVFVDWIELKVKHHGRY